MPYRIAGIDVHKRMLAVVVADVEVEGSIIRSTKGGTSPDQLRELAAWLVAREVEEVVMESTAQYWRPVWEALERYWQPRRRQRDGAGPRPARCTWRRRSRMRGRAAGRRIFRMRNGWSNGWSRRS